MWHLDVIPVFCGIFISLGINITNILINFLLFLERHLYHFQLGMLRIPISYIVNKHDLIILDRFQTNLSTVIMFSDLY